MITLWQLGRCLSKMTALKRYLCHECYRNLEKSFHYHVVIACRYGSSCIGIPAGSINKVTVVYESICRSTINDLKFYPWPSCSFLHIIGNPLTSAPNVMSHGINLLFCYRTFRRFRVNGILLGNRPILLAVAISHLWARMTWTFPSVSRLVLCSITASPLPRLNRNCKTPSLKPRARKSLLGVAGSCPLQNKSPFWSDVWMCICMSIFLPATLIKHTQGNKLQIYMYQKRFF